MDSVLNVSRTGFGHESMSWATSTGKCMWCPVKYPRWQKVQTMYALSWTNKDDTNKSLSVYNVKGTLCEY